MTTTEDTNSLAEQLMARHKATAEENGSVDEVAENFTNGHSAEIESAPASEPSSAAVSEDIPEPDTPATSVDSAGSSESTSKGKKANKIDVSSFDAFPKLGALNKSGSSTAGAWSKQPTLKPVRASAIPTGHGSQVIRAPPKVQTTSENFNLSLEERRFKVIPADVLKKVRSANNVQVECSTSKNTGVSTFIIKGKAEDVQKARRDLIKGLTVHITETIKVPASSRASIIGPKGSNLRPIEEKSGAKIQVAKKSETPVVADEDDEPLVDVVIEGDREGVEIAKKEIQTIVSSRVRHVNLKISNIPSKVYPALAGADNSQITSLEQERGLKINVPDHFYTSPNNLELPITISGERTAAIEAKAHIEQLAQKILMSYASFNKAVSGALKLFISPSDVFAKTGIIVTPTAEGSSWELFGPANQIQNADKFVSESAAKIQASRLCISKAHDNNVKHSQILARYFSEFGKLDELSKEHNVIVSGPSKEVLTSPETKEVNIDIVGNNPQDVQAVRKSLISLVNKFSPTNVLVVNDIDPFFFKNLHSKSKHASEIKREFVDILAPEDAESSRDIALIYAGNPNEADDDFSPGLAEIKNHLDAANKCLDDIRNHQKDISTTVIEVPVEDHKYILGPNGTTLNAILKGVEKDSFVTVHLGDSYKPDGLDTPLKPESVVIRGLSKHVTYVTKEIEQAVEDGRNYLVLSSYTTDFQFPAEFVNRLIGKGGSNLTKLREEFGVKIDVNADGEGTIKGIKKNAEEAKQRIFNLGRRWADEVTLRLSVPNNYHATLIGPGGKFVKRLEDKYDVHIRFPRANETEDDFRDKPNSPDEIVVRGPSRGAAKTKEEIMELVQYEKDNNNTDVVLVPAKALSRVIGRGGEFINDIKDSTNTRIDVGEHDESEGSDKKVPITITGTKTGIKQAAERINAIVKEVEDTITEEIEVDPKYHRYLIGANGSAMREIITKAGEEFNPRLIQVPQAGSGSNKIKIHGRKKGVNKIISIIKSIVDERENLVELLVPISIERHGSIIGPAGQTKKEIETECGVIITVPYQGSKNSKGDLEKDIKVIGSEENVQKAKARILEIAADDLKVDVPIAYQNLVFDSGMLIKKLRSDLDVRADLGRASFSKDPFSKIPTDAIGETLITDENPAAKYKWTVVAEPASTPSSAPGQPDIITWRFKGPSENCKKAKEIVEKALDRARKYDTTGYLWLADPSKYRLVIGPSGSTINNIRDKSECSVAVPKANAKKEENAIVIRGEKSNVEKAVNMVLDVVKRNN